MNCYILPKLFCALIISIFFLTCVVSAKPDISSYDIDFKIVKDKVLATYTINLENAQQFSIDLPEDLQVLDFYLDSKLSNFSIQDLGDKKRIDVNNSKAVKINFITEQLLDKSSKRYFTYNVKMPLDTKIISVKLTLPEQAILDKPDTAYPAPDEKTTDGQYITLSWEKTDLKQYESFSAFVIFREEKNTTTTAITVASVAIVLSFLIFIFARKRKKKEVKKRSNNKKIKELKELHLLDSEESVIKVLKEAKGELWQKRIQLQTGFSKAKLSRIIRNLEARRLVKKIPIGNTNKIKLS